jgi:predicted enzyme related to lactoylglutathione lyase
MQRFIATTLGAVLISLAMTRAATAADAVVGAKLQQVLCVGVEANDVGRSARFYTEVFGLKAVAVPGSSSPAQGNGAALQYITLSFTGNLDETGLIIRHQAAPAVASHPVVEFKVADVAAVVARAKAQGAVVVSEPHTPGSANFIAAVLKDPDGNLVEILQPR